MTSELIFDQTETRGARFYTIKCWYGLWTRDYMIRYTWDNGSKKYTRCKRIANPRSALFFLSYTQMQCERHISGHTSTLARRALMSCRQRQSSTPTGGRNSTSTPAQRQTERTSPCTAHTYRPLWKDVSKSKV